MADDLRLDWHAVKEMDKLYMREQLIRAGEPRPAVIGIDEISIRKGHVYRIVVSDLERHQPIWFGGVDRSEESMAILYDKCHVLRHLNEAIDQVRKAEYKRLTNRTGSDVHQGPEVRAALASGESLARQAAPTPDTPGREQAPPHGLCPQGAVRAVVGVPARGLGAEVLRPWRASLRWQRLKPFEKFAALIERHWDGITAYCQPENKVALGFVEGLNNKIRVIQRRCYGLRDEDYLHLKILTCTLPPLPRT